MDYKKLADDLISGCEENCANCKYAGDSEFECTIAQLAANAITDLLVENQALRNAANGFKERAEAAVKELEKVSTAVDDLSDFIDEEVHPWVPYDIYTALRENADAISVWEHEEKWNSRKEK